MTSARSDTGVAKTVCLTVLALIAFAGNSVLCRLALSEGAIDAAGFTTVRIVSGAIALLLLLSVRRGELRRRPLPGSWTSAAMLFLYAICFSFAYLSLDTGVGALILFGTVQATMIGGALVAGERPSVAEWAGWLVAAAGFVYLVSPGITAPAPAGALLMTLAGIGWGIYSLRGRGETRPLAGTACNFLRAVPFAVVLAIAGFRQLDLSAEGIVLAVISGAVTSGVGYAIWYAALRSISSMRAAMVQLAVPALAAAGGVVFVAERPSLRLVLSGALILGGIAIAIIGKARVSRQG